MNVSAYFDIQDILINELIGNLWLFILIGFAIILIVSIKKNLPFQVISMLSVLWFGIVFIITKMQLIWAFVVLGVGAIFYYMVSKIMDR